MNIEKEKRAIQYLKMFEPESEPYYLCYSGGKDSDCIRILAELAGVRHDINHNLTTVDAPETVRYIRTIPNVIINKPELSMWQLIVKNKMPPTRIARYCCKELKEKGGFVRIIGKPKTVSKLAVKNDVNFRLTEKGGVVLNDDNSETRRFVEQCYRTTSTMVNPIVDWTDKDVWEFLHHYGCASNPLYQCGAKRIGCIGCPLQNFRGMKKDFANYPKYRAAYVRTFDKMVEARKKAGLETNNEWADGEHVMRWWVGDDPLQVTLFDYLESQDVEGWR